MQTGLTRGEGDRAMLPMEAFNSSTEGATNSALSASRGLILILNFLRWSSSSSDSLDEKKWDLSLGVGSQLLRKALAFEHGRYHWSKRTKKLIYLSQMYTRHRQLIQKIFQIGSSYGICAGQDITIFIWPDAITFFIHHGRVLQHRAVRVS